MKKNYLLKSVIVMIAVLFSFSVTYAQEATPKVVNLTELLTPVIGEDGPESFQFTFQAGAAWGDFNNDGYLDLITSGIYIKYPEFDLDGEPIPNLDEDGNELDLPDPLYDPDNGSLNGNWIRSTKLYKNNGDGTFTRVAHPFPHFDTGGITWLDYDNDGNLDVFIAGRTNDGRYSGLWRNLGPENDYAFEEVMQGYFQYMDVEGGNRPSRFIAAGDYDNDGWVDLAFIGRIDAEEHEAGRVVSLYKNYQGEFDKVDYPVRGVKPFVKQNGGSIAWGDYNNDGLLDLICFGYFAGGGVQSEYYSGDDFSHGGLGCIYTNNGDGTFAEPIIFPAGEDGEVAWGDYNNDGKLDFIFPHYSWWPEPNNGWRFDLFENNGDGTFKSYNSGEIGFGSNGTQSATVAWGDINNDGYEDFASTGNSVDGTQQVAVFYNNAGKLPFTKNYLLFDYDGVPTTGHLRGGTICFVDFDNDGDLDIFVNGYEDMNLRPHLFRNDLDDAEGIPTNLPPSAPTNLKVEVDADGATVFSWDAATDDLTPPDALRYNLYVKQGNVTKMVLPADLQTGRLKVNETLAPIMGTTYKMYDVEGNFEWGVQAIDNGKSAGAFAKEAATSIKPVKQAIVKVTGKKQAIEVKAANDLQGTLNVYSINGVNLYSKAGQINGTTVELPAGAYIVKIVSTEGMSVDKVMVK